MANAYTATTDVTGFIPNYYSKVFLERLNPGPIMMDYCVKKPLPGNNGKFFATLYSNVYRNFTKCWKLLKPFVLTSKNRKDNNG